MDAVRDLNCAFVEEHSLVSAYVGGRLSEEEADAFEKHFFGCETCWAEVQSGQEVRTAIRRGRAKAGAHAATSLRTWKILAIAAGMAAAVLGALLFLQTRRTSSARATLTPLEAVASAANGSRTTEARLTLNIPHAPLTRGAQGLDRSALRSALEKAQAAEPSAENARAIGLAQLLLGNFEAAVGTLDKACHSTYPKEARVCSDLSAAYLARSDSSEREPHDRERALDAALEAVARDHTLPEALFNRALARERLSMTGTARKDWEEYLERDTEESSAWRAEAKEHIDADESSAHPSWPFVRERLLKKSGGEAEAETTRLVRAFPIRSEHLAAEELLASWARTGDEGDLRNAERIAEEFSRLTKDNLLKESIALIRHSGSRQRKLLARAHEDYAEGRRLSAEGNYEAALLPLERARRALTESASPFALEAAVGSADARFNRNDMRATLRELEPLSLWSRRSYPVLFARVRWLTGLAESCRGHPVEALEAYSDAETIYMRIGEVENGAFLDSLLADVYSEIGDARSAEAYRARGLRGLETTGSATRRYVALCSLADAANQAGLYVVAGEVFAEAALAGQAAETPDIVADALASAARAAAARGDRAETTRLLGAAEAICRRIADPVLARRETAEIHMARAELASDSDEALREFAEAEPFFRSRGDLPRLVEIKLACANRYLQKGQRRLARQQLAAGIELIEQERSNLPRSGQRIGFLQAREQLFDRAIQLAADDGDAAGAARIAERARARTLLEISSHSAPVLAPEDIALRLPADTAILELSDLPDRVLSLVYRGGNVSLSSRAAPSETISALVERVQRTALRPDADRVDALAQLFRIVLEPVLTRIAGARRLIIVPDKELCGLPFAALRQPSGRLLVEDFELGIAPSASVFVRNERRSAGQSRVDESVLVVADPIPPPFLAAELPRLPRARREASEIQQLYPGAILLRGSEATRSRVLAQAADATLIHFAGHALLGHGAGMSGLVLSSETGGNGSSILYASDVMDLRLPRARLVVLGACNTARGERRGPEGVMSMASAFLAAGVPIVLGTLAPVDDTTAARLLSRFHQELARTGDPFSSLRAAQLSEVAWSLANNQPVESWSAFQLIGG